VVKMEMKNRNIDIKDILFWIFLLLGIGLLLWNVLGNSPEEFIAT